MPDLPPKPLSDQEATIGDLFSRTGREKIRGADPKNLCSACRRRFTQAYTVCSVCLGRMKHLSRPTVKLIGEGGNAFSVLGKVILALEEAGYSPEQVNEYKTAAMAGNYDELLHVTLAWIDVT